MCGANGGTASACQSSGNYASSPDVAAQGQRDSCLPVGTEPELHRLCSVAISGER